MITIVITPSHWFLCFLHLQKCNLWYSKNNNKAWIKP
jgi:hypothetical protein